MVEDHASSGPQERAEGEVLVVRGDLNQTGFTLLLELGVEHATVSLFVVKGVGLGSTYKRGDTLTSAYIAVLV